ncbi:MAG: chemotaxis protein CheA [Geobacteraceae bacterium]|nr:chemotaxis protein CheA [Geobacteraceae bacterium]
MSDSMDISVLIEEFIEDANSHVESIEGSLMELEKRWGAGTTDKALLTHMLGSLHTLKGNTGMMGFTPLQDYVHKLETLFKSLHEEELLLSPPAFEVFYSAVSALRRSLASLANDAGTRLDLSEETMLLEILGSGAYAEETPFQNVHQQPPVKATVEEHSYITSKSTTLKVSFEKLDELLNLVGELVIHKTALTALEKRLREQLSDRALLDTFSEASQLIGKSSNDLREAIMKARMLPIKSVFHRFHRLVRDHTKKSGKEITLRFEGEETELDKTVIDEIGEPLLHLIRNAVDHGIESKEERRRSGKTSSGTITLGACHESNHIVISVADDGKGIDPENIRSAAIEKGVIDESEARNLSREEILHLIFCPGFSTSSEVTETSGRGIGLDVVKKIVTSLNGIIDITSEPGKGTKFTVKLPLTLAIITALMVDVGGETFAIPLSGVVESIKVASDEIHMIGTGEVINLRNQLLPICRLGNFFKMSNLETKPQEYVVVVASGEKRGGLIVNRLLGQQEIVIKALDDYLGELPGISGGTILGDGNISMIVDINAVLAGMQQIRRENTI